MNDVIPSLLRSSRWALPAVAALELSGCFYGYGTDTAVTRVTAAQYPPTDSVTLYYRPPSKDEQCVPIAFIEIASARFEETASILPHLCEQAMVVGADTLFSVGVGQTARSQGELLSELDPKNKPTVYSSHVVTGLAARCDLRTTALTAPPGEAYGYPFGDSKASVAARCVAQGGQWQPAPQICVAAPGSREATIAFGFCGDALCRVEVRTELDPWRADDLPLPSALTHASVSLVRSYGLATAASVKAPSYCQGSKLLDCVADSSARYTYQWTWKTGQSIWLDLSAHSGSPALRVLYDVSKVQNLRAATPPSTASPTGTTGVVTRETLRAAASAAP